MGILYVVATPIGNLSDFSPRAIETLKNSDIILVEDTRQTIKLLNHFNIKVKMISYHKFNELKRCDEIINYINEGKKISLVSDAGTPCISDPGYLLVKKARENNIDVIGIPGCSAVIDALQISGLDTSSFTFYGFVPTENKKKKELYAEIKKSKVKTKVLYESPKRILNLLKEIRQEFPRSMVCVLNELTKIYEKSFFGTIESIYDIFKNKKEEIKGEFVVLISNIPIEDNLKNQESSIESLIVDTIVKNKCSIKEAINLVSSENKKLSKKDVYNASLNLKSMIN